MYQHAVGAEVIASGRSKLSGHLLSRREGLALRGGSSSASESKSAYVDGDGDNSDAIPTSAVTVDFHSMTAMDCLRNFQVEQHRGLSQEVALERRTFFGQNILQPQPTVPLWHLILEQFEDRLVQILLGVAMLSSFLAAIEKDVHAFAEPIIILSILTINAAVGVWQSKSAEDSLDALKKLQPETACVLREGVWQGEFPVSEIVPGDIIYLRVGDKVPADARIISLKTTTFSTDESTLTGESLAVLKDTDPVNSSAGISGKINTVFSGTMISNGGCYAVVTGTGKNTEIGKINDGVIAAGLHQVKTPLTQKLDEFGAQLTKAIGTICVIVWVVSIPKFNSPVFGGWLKGEIKRCEKM